MKKTDFVKLREQVRQWEKKLVEELGPLDGSLEEFYVTISLPDGHNTEMKVVRPKDFEHSKPPLIVLFHGGAFLVGTVEMVTRPARDFAKHFGAVVVAATYRLAPENKFPMQVEDAWNTLAWLAENASAKFGARLDQAFILGGFSAGASIAAVLVQQARDRHLASPLTGAFISIPLLLVEEIVPAKYRKDWTSREENNQDPALNKESLKEIIGNLKADIKSPLFSPFNAPDPHRGLPPTYVQVCGLDPLRDDGLIYEKDLRENGVQTRLDNYPQLSHAAWTVFANESSPKELEINTLEAMKWLLGRN
jgi:acetyl esterase/lipase